MQKLVDFSELSTLQIDQIYHLFISLFLDTKNEPDRMFQKCICPHTVNCSLQRMEFDKRQCNICLNRISPLKKYQLSGILFFLLGGLREGQGTVEEFYTYGQDYFSPIYGIFSDQLIFRSLCFLINETEYEKKNSMYQKIRNLNDQIQPKIYKYELKKFCIVIVDPGLGFLYKQTDIDERTLINSFKKFMEEYEMLLNSLELRFKDFKICIHNLFLGSKTNKYYYLKFNLFYDYLCKCQQNKFSSLFYQILINQSYDKNSDSQIRSLAKDIYQLSEHSNEENDFIELMKLLKEFLDIQQSLLLSNLYSQNLSFFCREIMYQLKGFQSEDLLWKGYKILYQQEIVELIENQISKYGNPSSSSFKKLVESQRVQIQLIQEFSNYDAIPIFVKIINQYSNIIEQQESDQIDDIDYINTCPLLKKRIKAFEFLNQFNTFKDYKNTCNQLKLQPLFQEIDYYIIKQYEEQLKNEIQQ